MVKAVFHFPRLRCVSATVLLFKVVLSVIHTNMPVSGGANTYCFFLFFFTATESDGGKSF